MIDDFNTIPDMIKYYIMGASIYSRLISNIQDLFVCFCKSVWIFVYEFVGTSHTIYWKRLSTFSADVYKEWNEITLLEKNKEITQYVIESVKF
jgi:hypothetical protein